jgi:hypothetical protein
VTSLRFRARFDEGVEHIRCETGHDPAPAREERVRLEEVRNAAPVIAERRPRVGSRLDRVAFEHDRFVAGTRNREGSSQPGDSSTRNDKPHPQLHAGEVFYFVVRARDRAGNRETNEIERQGVNPCV